jgi:hypothetical protein
MGKISYRQEVCHHSLKALCAHTLRTKKIKKIVVILPGTAPADRPGDFMKALLRVASKSTRGDDQSLLTTNSRINPVAAPVPPALSFSYRLLRLLLQLHQPGRPAMVGWLVAMTRAARIGHFFFEPKGYDPTSTRTDPRAQGKRIKVGYNLRRKVVSPLDLGVVSLSCSGSTLRFIRAVRAETTGAGSFSQQRVGLGVVLARRRRAARSDDTALLSCATFETRRGVMIKIHITIPSTT